MMPEDIRQVLSYRIKLQPEDDIATEECWKKETNILSRDIESTIHFLTTEAADDELAWLSEVFDDVIEATHSHAILDAIKQRAKNITDADCLHSVNVGIRYAEYNL